MKRSVSLLAAAAAVVFGAALVQASVSVGQPAPDFRVKAFDPAEGLSLDQLDQRWRLLDRLRSEVESAPASTSSSLSAAEQRFQRFQQRARDLVNGPAARQAFDLNQERSEDRDRYGRHPLGQYLLMARRLVESGVRLVTVTGCLREAAARA